MKNKTLPKTTNENVIEAFFNRREAQSWTGSLSTTGNKLYSYKLEIARTDDDGGFVIFDYTAPAGGFASNTTSQHVGMVKRSAPSRITTIMRPDTASQAGLI
jgi:hypothetical protein